MFQTDLDTAHEVAVRVLHDTDAARLGRIAARDSAPVPSGRMLGAEVDGALVAAISLSDGSIVADPFSSTAVAVEHLQLRARQLGGSKRRRLLPRLRRPAQRQRSRGSLAGSPPGGAGNLLQL